MSDTIENDNSINASGDVITDDSLTAEERLTALQEQNKKLFARAKTAEGFTQDSEGKWVKKQAEAKPITTQQEIPKASDILKADEFKLYRQGYTEQEIDLIMHNGGAKILEDKKSPLVLGLIAAREQRGAEEASAMVSETSGLSDIERKYTDTELRAMSKEDLAKLLPKVQH